MWQWSADSRKKVEIIEKWKHKSQSTISKNDIQQNLVGDRLKRYSTNIRKLLNTRVVVEFLTSSEISFNNAAEYREIGPLIEDVQSTWDQT